MIKTLYVSSIRLLNKGGVIMSKKKKLTIGIVACVVLVMSILVIYMWNSGRRDTSYELSDMAKEFFNEIIRHYQFTNEILDTNKIKSRHINAFTYSPLDSELTMNISMAHSYDFSLTRESIKTMRKFYFSLLKEYSEGRKLSNEDVLVEMDISLREKIEMFNLIYEGWVKAIDEMEAVDVKDGELITSFEGLEYKYKDASELRKDYNNFLIRLAKETENVIDRYGVDSMEEFLYGESPE
jgi:hypothetical protein